MNIEKWGLRFGLFGLLLPPCLLHAGTLKEALDAVPLDTLAMVCIPNPSGLDAELKRTIKSLALEEVLPPAVASPMTALQAAVPVGECLDLEGTLVVGVLNAPALSELSQRAFLLLPSKDPKKLIETMGGQAGAEAGVWSLTFMGSPVHAAIRGKHAVFCQSPTTAIAVAADSSRALGDVMSREDVESLERQDFFLWVKLEEGLKLVKPQLDLFLSMSLLAQSAKGPAGMKQAEMTKKQVATLLQGLSTLIVGVAFEEHGSAMRIAVRARPGSELDQGTRRHQTAEPLLIGLPAESFLVAAGSRSTPEMVKHEIETSVRPMLAIGEAIPGIDRAKYAEFSALVEDWAGMMTGSRFALVGSGADGVPEGGLLGAILFVDTSDPRRWVERFGQGLESMKGLFTADGVEIDPTMKSLLSAVRWSTETEDLGGTKAARLTVDLSNVEKVRAEDVRIVTSILGRDGLCARVAVVDDHSVMLTVGGGRKLPEMAIEAGRRKSSALEESSGVKKTASGLPKDREGIGFAAVDRIVNILPSLLEAVGAKHERTISMPVLEAPVGMTQSGAEHVSRVDVYFPNELLRAVKDAAMSAKSRIKDGDDASRGSGEAAGNASNKPGVEEKKGTGETPRK